MLVDISKNTATTTGQQAKGPALICICKASICSAVAFSSWRNINTGICMVYSTVVVYVFSNNTNKNIHTSMGERKRERERGIVEKQNVPPHR